MNWLKKWIGTHSKVSAPRRPQAKLQLEALEDRQLLSVSPISAITTHQSSGVTNHDLYAITAGTTPSTQCVVDYNNGTPINLNQNGPQGVKAVSAGIDPQGKAEVFALDGNQALWRYDGSWQKLSPLRFKEISATQTYSGQVYAATDGSYYGKVDVDLFNASGGLTNLAAPGGYATGISASRDQYGLDEIFVVDGSGNIQVNDPIYGWRMVDSRFNNSNLDGFTRLSATQSGDVYALTSQGKLFQEMVQVYNYGGFISTSWIGRQFATGRQFQAISADTDANGHSEVYAIEQGTGTAYRYDVYGNEASVDSNVSEISGAGGGYFFDVNPSSNGSNTVWAYDPNGPWVNWQGYWFQLSWSQVGSNVL
jgi:hypothetical protein